MAGFLFMKKCTRCGVEKEYSCFRKNSNQSDGYNTVCNSCLRAKHFCTDCGKQINYAPSGKCHTCYSESIKQEYATCPFCGEQKHRAEFKQDTSKSWRKDTRQFTDGCNDCRKARTTVKKETKVCIRCSEEKQLDAFTRKCKICEDCKQAEELQRQEELKSKAQQRQTRKLEEKKRIKAAQELFQQGYKYCPKCEQTKELDKFSRNTKSRDGKQNWCQQCMNIRREQWAKDNPERDKELELKYKQTDRYKITHKNIKYERRQKLAKTPKELRLTAKHWKAVLDLCGNVCLSCGSTEDITIDHVKPLSLGGLNTVFNVQPLCHHCNSIKRDTEIDYRPKNLLLYLDSLRVYQSTPESEHMC